MDEIRDAGKVSRKAYSYTVTEAQGPRNEEVRHLRRSAERSYPAATMVRVFVPETSAVRVTFLSSRQMFYARILAAVLIPALFVHSVPRAYADEVLGATDVSAPVDVVATPEAPTVEVAATPEAPIVEVVSPEVAPASPTVEEAVQPEAVSAESVSTPTEQTEPVPTVAASESESTPPPVVEEPVVATIPDAALPTSTALSAETSGAEAETGDTATDEAEAVIPPPTPTQEIISEETPTEAAVSESTETTGAPAVAETPGIIERIADVLGGGGSETASPAALPTPPTSSVPPSTEILPTPDAPTPTLVHTPSTQVTSTDETVSTTTEEQMIVASSSVAEKVEEASATGAQREEQLRQELRKQVEEEFLRGCISFEASGYYCLNGNVVESGVAAPEKVVTTVESASGSNGNKEIFVIKNGTRIALTASDFDNAFPSQDISGEQFVWQGMQGGRWQIFFGALSSLGIPTVTQVTDARDSNFNPKVDGAHLVWQGWVDDNWEIFLATKRDARSPFAGEHLPEGNALLGVGPEWSVERLTTNAAPDMFPSLHGDIVTWQAHEGDNWVVYAYSIAERTQIKLSSDGTKSENPRFAITWEERDEEGGVRLMSYDMSSGAKTNLTDEAMKVSDKPFREKFPAPISQPNQATLPGTATSTGTSTPSRGGDDDSAGGPNLPTS